MLTLAVVVSACGGDGNSAGPGGVDPAEEVATTGERSVQVTGAGRVRLAGTLLVPPPATPAEPRTVPAVLIVPTLGAGNRNGPVPLGANAVDPLAEDLAKAFAASGVASYRYDHRGTGESRLEPEVRLSFDDLVADARAGIDLLAQRKETAGRDLSVVGYDEGGLVALRLAVTDPRIKRVVLISTPGRPVGETQAARLAAQFGPESGAALRAALSQLLATRTLPPPAELRTELRPLLSPDEIPFLAELYSLDPAAEAARVRVPTLVVAPADTTPFEPDRLAQALGGAQVLVAANAGPTLQIVGPAPPSDDPGDPASASHVHGAGPAQAATTRDAETVGRISSWLAGGSSRPPA